MTKDEARKVVIDMAVYSLRNIERRLQMKNMPKGSLPSDMTLVVDEARKLADELEKKTAKRKGANAEDAEVVKETKK